MVTSRQSSKSYVRLHFEKIVNKMTNVTEHMNCGYYAKVLMYKGMVILQWKSIWHIVNQNKSIEKDRKFFALVKNNNRGELGDSIGLCSWRFSQEHTMIMLSKTITGGTTICFSWEARF